jgi:putative Ca2+/H+ antiporter (TMEM165/GDT1 family)
MEQLQLYSSEFLLLITTFVDYCHSFLQNSGSAKLTEFIATSLTCFALIVAAEMGDKSQLVCMTLASKHKAMPVFFGAVVAFAFLNTLAVVFGLAIANWLPEYVVAGIVAALFAGFGFHSLLLPSEQADEDITEKTGHGVFFTTFFLITVAEFGDKTQLAVVALSSTSAAVAVWLGSTLALATTSALGILAGRTVLRKLPLNVLHKISGSIFLVLAMFASNRAYSSFYV